MTTAIILWGSIHTFRSFLVVLPDGTVDASRIHSRECYSQWLANRSLSQDPDLEIRKFQRALSNHISGSDSRVPFSLEEECAILQVLRLKEKWPCSPDHLEIGGLGFRGKGYHEKLVEEEGRSSKLQKLMPEGEESDADLSPPHVNTPAHASVTVWHEATSSEKDSNKNIEADPRTLTYGRYEQEIYDRFVMTENSSQEKGVDTLKSELRVSQAALQSAHFEIERLRALLAEEKDAHRVESVQLQHCAHKLQSILETNGASARASVAQATRELGEICD
jgi:hypothetical protein